MTSEEYWIKNKTKLQLNERSYNAFEMGINFCENNIADIKANCDLAIEGRDIKIKELEKKNKELKCFIRDLIYENQNLCFQFSNTTCLFNSDYRNKAEELIGERL